MVSNHIISELLLKLELRLLFYPMKPVVDAPFDSIRDDIEDIYFKSGDDMLNAWYAAPSGNKPTILYCHGQGENVANNQETFDFLHQNGYGFFVPDYTGHGKSSGKPYENKIYQDIDNALKYLRETKNISEDKIIIWGRSLGGAIAAEASTRHNLLGVIIESSFTNIKDAALSIAKSTHKHGMFKFFRKVMFRMARFLPIMQNFDTHSKIHKIKSPLLIIHSKQDELIEYEQAIKNAKRNPKSRFILCEDGSHHNSCWAFEHVLDFIQELSPVEVAQPL